MNVGRVKTKKTLIIFILKIENSKFKLSKQIKLPLKLIFSKNILADIAIKAIILNFYKKKEEIQSQNCKLYENYAL